jgi:pullulanase/glycogen debranching enzyme
MKNIMKLMERIIMMARAITGRGIVVEGETDDPEVNKLRQQQKRNLLTTLVSFARCAYACCGR